MKKLLSFVTTLFFAITTFAQVDEATITVIGTGIDEERATLQALRSAIEQTFGAFVSANTTILNDSLIQDEIVSVSTGNVKKYEKIAVATMPNGHVSVSLTATVSVNKLISFVESKGVKAEFSGSMYAANIKLFRLKIQSIQKAYELMIQQMEHMAKNMFDFQFKMSEQPKRDELWIFDHAEIYYFDCYVAVISNSISSNFYNLYKKTVEELKLSEEDIEFCEREDIYWSNDMLGIALPIPYYYDYEPRIKKAIYDACYRYRVQEIDNSKNLYDYRSSEGKSLVDYDYIGFGDIDNESYDKNYHLYTRQWQSFVTSYTPYYVVEDTRHGYYPGKWELKRGEMSFANHRLDSVFFHQLDNSSYFTGSKIVAAHHFRVAIPVGEIENLKGFELIGVSEPIDSLSCVYQTFGEYLKFDTWEKYEVYRSAIEEFYNEMQKRNDHISGETFSNPPIPKSIKEDIQEKDSTTDFQKSTPTRSSSTSNSRNSTPSRTNYDNNSYRRSSSYSRSYGTYPRRYGF